MLPPQRRVRPRRTSTLLCIMKPKLQSSHLDMAKTELALTRSPQRRKAGTRPPRKPLSRLLPIVTALPSRGPPLLARAPCDLVLPLPQLTATQINSRTRLLRIRLRVFRLSSKPSLMTAMLHLPVPLILYSTMTSSIR